MAGIQIYGQNLFNTRGLQAIQNTQRSSQYNLAASRGQVAGPVNPSSQYFAADQQRRNVLGASIQRQNITGGGGQVQQSAPQQSQPQQNQQQNQVSFDLESKPQWEPPMVDISDELAAAEAKVSQANADLDVAIKGVDVEELKSKGKIQEEKATQTSELKRQQTEAEGLAEENVNELRKAQSEMQQGLLARYGTGVSTGLGAAAILGGQTIKSIGNVRRALAGEIEDYNRKRQILDLRTLQAEKEIEESTKLAKKEARAAFNASFAAAAELKGTARRWQQSEINKARSDYSKLVTEIESRNKAAVQKLYLQKDQQAAELVKFEKEAKKAAAKTDNAYEEEITKQLVELYKAGAIKPGSPAEAELNERLNIKGQGSFTTPTNKEKDPIDQMIENALKKRVGTGLVYQE